LLQIVRIINYCNSRFVFFSFETLQLFVTLEFGCFSIPFFSSSAFQFSFGSISSFVLFSVWAAF
jgi:hypothetical protein